MNPQDVAVGLFALIVVGTLGWGTSGPRHRGVHNVLVVVASMIPFVAFDLSRAAELPTEVWAFCAAYVVGHSANAAYHYLRPEGIHANSGEAIMQVTFAVWAAVVRMSVAPELWYRGSLGTALFCLATIWVTLVVLVSLYQSELTSHARDAFDFLQEPLNSKSNAAILTATPATMMLALYVAFLNPWFIVAAFGSWVVLRVALTPDPTTA